MATTTSLITSVRDLSAEAALKLVLDVRLRRREVKKRLQKSKKSTSSLEGLLVVMSQDQLGELATKLEEMGYGIGRERTM